jgi:hypothetical protein
MVFLAFELGKLGIGTTQPVQSHVIDYIQRPSLKALGFHLGVCGEDQLHDGGFVDGERSANVARFFAAT